MPPRHRVCFASKLYAYILNSRLFVRGRYLPIYLLALIPCIDECDLAAQIVQRGVY